MSDFVFKVGDLVEVLDVTNTDYPAQPVAKYNSHHFDSLNITDIGTIGVIIDAIDGEDVWVTKLLHGKYPINAYTVFMQVKQINKLACENELKKVD